MFQPVGLGSASRFNSAISSNFLDDYDNFVVEKIRNEESRQPSQTFAPSSIRCKRISWFRLRGVAPEQEVHVDKTLNFSAQVGTACHRIIQENLENWLGDDWIDVESYLRTSNRPYSFSCTKSGSETNVIIEYPPIKFSPDGIIRYGDKLYLLEIKTSEYSSFDKLTDPKPQHVDQIKCYCTLLGLSDALVLYQDRQYGDFKCYEVHILDYEMQAIWDMFKEVLDCVKKNIAPSKLPGRDPWCTPAHCRYYNKCKEW